MLSGKHFLAAEDNFLNAGILTDLLEMEGATVEIVENGKLVVERFERCEPGEFDAILMDVQMPVMNGHAAARAIRALARPDAATIPIFAMTADAFVEDEKAALAGRHERPCGEALRDRRAAAPPSTASSRKDDHETYREQARPQGGRGRRRPRRRFSARGLQRSGAGGESGRAGCR